MLHSVSKSCTPISTHPLSATSNSVRISANPYQFRPAREMFINSRTVHNDMSDTENRYSYYEVDDVSHNAARRYDAIVIVEKRLSQDELRSLIPKMIDEVRTIDKSRNDIVKERWGGTPVHVVWLKLYNESRDRGEMIANDLSPHYVAKAEWVDPTLEERFAPMEMRDPDEVVDGIRIEWSNKYSE